MQNKVVRLHASGGVNRFRARFSQSLTDRPWVYAAFNAALAGLAVAGGFLVWFSFRFVFTVARENQRENGGGGRRGAAGKNHLHSIFPSPIAFWFNFGSAFARLYLVLNESQKEKNTPKNKPSSTQATRKEKSVYGKRQLAATDHYFP